MQVMNRWARFQLKLSTIPLKLKFSKEGSKQGWMYHVDQHEILKMRLNRFRKALLLGFRKRNAGPKNTTL